MAQQYATIVVLCFGVKRKRQCGKKTTHCSEIPHVFLASNAGTYYEASNGVVEERALEKAEKCKNSRLGHTELGVTLVTESDTVK